MQGLLEKIDALMRQVARIEHIASHQTVIVCALVADTKLLRNDCLRVLSRWRMGCVRSELDKYTDSEHHVDCRLSCGDVWKFMRAKAFVLRFFVLASRCRIDSVARGWAHAASSFSCE